MRLSLKCTGCVFNSALEAIKLAGIAGPEFEQTRKKISNYLHSLSLDDLPPELVKNVYSIVQDMVGGKDIYADIKKESNHKISSIFPYLKEKVAKSADPLKTATQLAILANNLDYLKISLLSADELLLKIEEEFLNFFAAGAPFFDYVGFAGSLDDAESILYIADNAGEIFFDRLLLEEIAAKGKKDIYFVVKSAAIFNDALVEDALFCGIDKYASIISCGSNATGIILKDCSPQFIDIYNSAQLVLSKGHSNYTGLSLENKLIYFLFLVNCRVIANDIGAQVGSVILHRA